MHNLSFLLSNSNMLIIEAKLPKILKYLWMFLLFSPISCKYSEGSTCGSTVTFSDCSDDASQTLVLSRHFENIFVAKYDVGKNCKIQKVGYYWGVAYNNGTFDIQEESNKQNFTYVLPPYSITYQNGISQVMFYVHEYYTNKADSGEIYDVCNFEVSREDPIPHIKGGSETTVESGKDYTISGAESIDMEVPSNEKGHLLYKWTCTVNKNSLSDLCEKDLGRDAITKIPASYAVDGLIYTFTLNVKSRESDWKSTKQVINILSGASLLEIVCLKNCPPDVLVTNSKHVTIFEVNCMKNCKKVNPDLYTWTINPEISYDTNTKYGRKGSIFYIIQEVLQDDRTYKVTVEIMDGATKGRTSREIKTYKSPVIEECGIQPQNGEALSTLFQVSCRYPKGPYQFEVYSVTDNSEVLLEKSTRLGNIEFYLNANVHVLVKMIDVRQFTAIYFLTPEVSSTLEYNNKNLEKQLNKRYFDKKSPSSVNNLRKAKKYTELMQVLNIMVDELNVINEDDSLKKQVTTYKTKLLSALNAVPLNSVELCKQAAAIAVKVADKNINSQNADIASKVTDICLDAVKNTLKHFEEVEHIGMYSDEIMDDGRLFSECIEIGLSSNSKAVQPKYSLSAATTLYPLLKIPVITEHYKDYIDDDGISKVITKFGHSTENMINLCLTDAKLLVAPLSPYQDPISIKHDLIELVAAKMVGKDLKEFFLASNGVVLKPPEDFVNLKEVKIFMCTSETNPFYTLKKDKLFTPLAIVEFRKDVLLTSFHLPFTVSFAVISNATATSRNGLSLRNPGSKLQNKSDRKYEAMTMYQIDVLRYQGYFIEFGQIDRSLDFYITQFHKPTRDEVLAKRTTINEAPYVQYVEHNEPYDTWDYLTIMPNNVGKVLHFKLKVYTYSCSRWDFSTRSWVYACAGTNESNAQNIVCNCYHTSVLTGILTNNNMREEHTVYAEHLLEVQASFVIFVSVLVLWILYCAFLTFISLLKDKDITQDIYFLSDIPSFYRFGYLIIVDTGSIGTTSNVMIKIYGSNTDSKEHVLNFPDPDKKIFRKGQEDWFFFATQYHLGDISKIDVWFDSVGYRPTWNCLEIELIDLQSQKNWFFEIDFKFEIRDSENYIFSAEPVTEKKLSWREMFIKRIKTGFREPYLWNIFYRENTLKSVERLSIVLSIFMTVYLIVLLFYGLPSFKITDSLDYYFDYGFDGKIVWVTIVATMLSFLIHYPIVFLFRMRLDRLENNNDKSIRNVKYWIFGGNRICWFILITIILISFTIVLIYGFWVPHITSLMWLTTSISSLIVYLLLFENLRRLIDGFLLKRKDRIKKIFSKSSSIIQYIESQRNAFYSLFGRLSMRPYFKRVYKPLDEDAVKERKYWAKEKEKLFETFEDIIMFGLYVLLLYIILAKNKDPMATVSNEEIRSLVQGDHIRKFSENILSRKDIENYLQATLIPSMHSQEWYERYSKKDPGCIVDNSNKFIGFARLRQHRAVKTSCKVPASMNFTGQNCIAPFSDGPEYGSFSQNWGNAANYDPFARLEYIWAYQSVWKTGTLSYLGKFATYPGGGFVAPLGRTSRNSKINYKYLTRNSWINECTRCLFVEFLTYNVNSNLFNDIKVVFEISPAGYIYARYEANTAKLLLVGEENNVPTMIVFFLFVSIVVLLSVRLINTVRRQKRMFFKDFWRLFDILIITITLCVLVLFFQRTRAVGEFLERVKRAKNNEFVNYFYLFYAESALTSLAAVLVFAATFRLWKLLRFLVIIKVVEKTLSIACVYWFCLFVVHFYLLLVCATAGYLLFRGKSRDFESFPVSLMNLILISLGFHQFNMKSTRSSLFCIYYCLYMIQSMIIVTVYIAVISMFYGEAQLYYSNSHEYNVFTYVKEQCLYYKELAKVRFKKCRLTGGEDADTVDKNKPVYPKLDEHRYAKCVTIDNSQLKKMRLITLNFIRNYKSNVGFTEKDAILVKETIVEMFKTDKGEGKSVFFLGNLEGEKVKLIDDERFLKMERLVNNLLRKKVSNRQSEAYKTVASNNDVLFDRISKNLSIVLEGLKKIELNG